MEDRGEILRGKIHYILEGKKPIQCINLMHWARWLETADRKVAFTCIAESIDVSTVFLGLDYNFLPHGRPLLFETMVFGGPLDDYMDRYCTWEEAEQGHKRIVQMVLDAIDHNGTEG